MDFLIESALLTHGLRSVTDDQIARSFPDGTDNIAWVDAGRVTISGVGDFLAFRARAGQVGRIDCRTLDGALRLGASGALTASGTMEVCAREGIGLAVTCGMGGIGDIRGEELCPDLPALRDIPVTLISTAPKDMLDRGATIGWLREAGVMTLGVGRGVTTGYVFVGEPVALDGWTSGDTPPERLPSGGLLVLNEIPERRRVADRSILAEAVLYAREAQGRGEAFHPAANARIDELTAGESSRIQLASIVANAALARSWTS
jgi:pseudouridine-5'-phosphate glycosidase